MSAHLLLKKSYGGLCVVILGLLFLEACQPQPSVPVTGGNSSVSSDTAPSAPYTQALPDTLAQQTPVTAAMPAVTGAAATEAVINVVTDAKLGQILVGNNGMTLYMFTEDGINKSNCSGNCAKYWPPLLTRGNPTLGAGVDKTLVGTAPLPDGTMIVTYNKMPLYYYVKDTKPGDTTGQATFNKTWFVVSPDGKAVGM
jgi:predicted lipoprotein with Yx(FWY)xxD motif